MEVPASPAPWLRPASEPLNLIKRVDPELPAGFELNERGFAQSASPSNPTAASPTPTSLKASVMPGLCRRRGRAPVALEPVKTAQQVAVQIEFASSDSAPALNDGH